ncbi:CHASE2 domain-containing protein [Catenovulum sediminis]|uniref:Adenylate/guanylate cyclase domain-containing protein n=1 Tax=Catenovulum sediminis TaxID=1740262 RepID=A0ABV1RGB5_9ALTE|nr:adenylate/guanylate cyclase domain-containing protein [Catenovulum sediminis]
MLKRVFSQDFVMGMLLTAIFVVLPYSQLSGVQNTLNRLEGILYDIRLNATLPAVPRKVAERVVIIDIDEKSMREQGRFPWSRAKLAELVDTLMAAGVIVAAFDIFFAEPEENLIAQLSQQLPDMDEPVAHYLQQVKTQVDADIRLANSLQDAEVVLGFLMHDEAQLAIGHLPESPLIWQPTENSKAYVRQFQAVIANIQSLQSSASGGGFINAIGEQDGFIRKAALVARYQDKLYPSLALETARIYTLSDEIETRVYRQGSIEMFQAVKIADTWIETDEYGQILIPYKGKQGSFPYYSATDVMTGRVGMEELAGTVVFVGTSAVGLADLRATPVGNQYPGVEVHANVFESLLHPEYMPFQPGETEAISLILVILTGILLAIVIPRQGPTVIVMFAGVMLAAHIALNWYLWSQYNVSLPYLILILLILTHAIYYSTTGYFNEASNRKQIKNMFGQYVPPAYLDKLMKAGKELELKSEKRDMTVLFTDVRSFTSISEQFTPEELSEYLNRYFSVVTKVIFDHRGTIDKYVGDMVMAFWNAPLDDDKHAENAVHTALIMQAETDSLSVEFQAKGWPAIKTGTGISTGPMNVGDMGSVYRRSYTVLGDSVNLGSRLEGLTKFYGVSILVSDTTMERCSNIAFRHIDKVKVVGKDNAVNIYEPIGIQQDLSSLHEQFLTLHQEGIDAYFKRDWDKATKMFSQLLEQKLLSIQVYQLYLKRIDQLRQENLPADWDGVMKHARK